MECPVCKNENPAGAKFCIKCGARFSQTCPKCGAGNLAEAVYCEQCGASLAPAETRRTGRRRTPYVAAFIGALLALAAIAVVALFVGPALDLWPSVWATPTAIPPTPEPAPDSGANIEASPADPLQDGALVPAEIESRGEWIAYQTKQSDGTVSLWVVRSDGEEPIELVSEVEAVEYTSAVIGEWSYKRTPFAPRGNHMLFKVQDAGQYSLYTYALGEDEVEGIVRRAEYLWYQFSPDGDRIAVDAYEGGDGSLLLMDVDGENEVSLFEGVEGWIWVWWLPDGRQLIARLYDQGEVSLLHMDDQGEEQLTIIDEAEDAAILISPDGSRIAYAVEQDGEWDVYVARADGSDPTRIERGLEDVGLLSFSPNGKQLLMRASSDGYLYDLYLMKTDGTDEITLARDVDDAGGGFCPGGKRILYVIWEDGDENLYLADADGENEVRVERRIDDLEVAFTPNGRTMIVGLETGSDWALYAVEVATGEMVELIGSVDSLGSLVVMDNRRVLFSAADGGDWSLYIARLDGEDLLELAGPVDGFDGYDASPDGRRIVYSEERSGEYRLYLIDIDGSNQEELAEGGFAPVWSD